MLVPRVKVVNFSETCLCHATLTTLLCQPVSAPQLTILLPFATFSAPFNVHSTCLSGLKIMSAEAWLSAFNAWQVRAGCPAAWQMDEWMDE